MPKLVTVTLALASFLCAADLKLGKPLALKETTSIASLASQPEKYAGKTVQTRGKVSEVCQAMGCWMNLVDDAGKMVRIKVEDGVIVFPKDSAGKTAVAEGRFAKLTLTKEQAAARKKHEAEVNGKKFDEAPVTGPVVMYQLEGTGAVIVQ